MADAPKDKKPETLTESQRIAIENARRDAMTPKNPQTTKTTMGQLFAKGGKVNMRKTKRYDEGGEVGMPEIPDVGTPYGRYKTATTDTFKEAFAEARANGDKTFEWNGKKYSTAMAGDSKPAEKPKMMDRSFKTASAQANANDEMAGARKGPAPKMPATRSGSILDRSESDRRAMVDQGLRIAEGERAMKAHKAAQKPMGYAKDGFVKAADGIAQRGTTRGKYV